MFNYFKNTLLITCLFISSAMLAQVDVTMSNSDFSTCSGFFLDSGLGGADYSNNEYFVFTICPDIPGDVINVDFSVFDLDQTGAENTWDYLAIFDGDDVSANTLGSYTGDQLQGFVVSATPQNTSGCLTFVWDTNDEGTGNVAGFVTCETPCDRPTAVATYDAPISHRICVGDEISFDGTGSFAAPGFVIDGFTWDFGDGTTDTDNLVTTHSWDEPGQYLTELFLLDDNGCSSSNLVSLEVLVATPPSWSPFPGDTTLCLGESLVMDAFPDDYELTWTGAETNYENPDNIILEDELGVPNQSEINIAGFEPGQTLVNPNDLDIGVSMNHSFLFDLVISLTCPSGQNILLHQQMAQPDGDDVGSNGTDLGIPDGDFYDYVWTADAAETWSQVGTTGDNESLPAGEYLSLQSMDGLIGCDLNGTWTLEIIDNWGGDDGELAAWNMAFNPQIIPDAPEFTPDIGSYSDSSFWSLTPPDGLGNLSLSDDGNVISFDSVDEGVWDFTYVATNNHGCINDSTVTVTIEEALQANAGPDLIFCGNTVLEGGLADIPSPQCTNDAGNYTFCYENNVNATFTYCPDNPGDGVTFVDITFNSGSVEGGWDDLYVYDGESNAAPLLAGPIGGDLTGLQFVATNATGCITIEVNPDGSGDCAGGGQTPWDYDVGCSATQPPYVFEWSPVDGLSDPNVATPTLSDLDQETTYTLYTYPIGRPDCASTDEMTVFPAFEYNVSSEAAICPNYPSTIEAFVDPNSGNGPWTIDLYEDNSLVQTIESTGGSTVFDELYSNDYNVIITELQCSFIEDVPLDIPVGLDVISSPDTTICIGGTATIEAELSQAVDNLVFYWSNGESGVDNIDVTPTQESEVTVYAGFGDNCFTESDTITISFYDPLELSIIGDAELCFGDSSFVAVNTETGGLPPYSYSWAEDGSDVSQLASQWVTPDETKTWCLTLTDACETPSVQECVELIVDLEIPTTFTADTLGGCLPVLVNFNADTDADDAIAGVVWDFGDLGSSNLVHSTSHNYLTSGVYDVSLTITSEIGCVYTNTEEEQIAIYRWPLADFTTDPTTAVLPNTSFDFINYSNNADDYFWTFDDYGDSEEINPEFTFPEGQLGVYTVSLNAINEWGCTDSIARQVVVIEDFILYAPNAFTPDNDGINDFWYATGIDVDPDEYEVQIYNRWGEVVFLSTDLNEIWDGSVNNGEYFAEDGVYNFRIETRSLTTSDPKEIIGHITLIR